MNLVFNKRDYGKTLDVADVVNKEFDFHMMIFKNSSDDNFFRFRSGISFKGIDKLKSVNKLSLKEKRTVLKSLFSMDEV